CEDSTGCSLLSESLLASTTIPICSLTVGEPLDIIISVHCSLPQAYSYQSLVSTLKEQEANAAAVAAGGRQNTSSDVAFPTPSEPVAIVCRTYVSLLLECPKVSPMYAEIAALSLPKSIWTPDTLLDETD